MCGIAGILSLQGRPVWPEEIRAMCSALVHRGPDDEGLYLGDGIGLGMRRLSIIDLETGSQPVRSEDGSVVAVFNGEIYNFARLRADLTRRGHVFRSTTDTEVIVHLYEERGDSCVDDLRGMFAFALWDARRRRLLLARDRLGIKPLYYAEFGGRLLFGSELKALLELPDLARDLNWRAVGHLFTSLSTPADESILQGVRKLEPAHILTASPGRTPRTERYWEVRFVPERGRSEESFVEGLKERLEESVRLHLASDVPLGAFLSGGLDSSSVVATMARVSSMPVRTFSIGFREEAYDELRHARCVAERFGTEHHELILEPDVLEILDDLAWHLDEPFGDPSAIPTFVVSRMAADHVKVVLSGDGGDELFAGYDKYRVEQRERRYSRLPRFARKALAVIGSRMREGAKGRNFALHHSLTGWDRYFDAGTFFRERSRQELLHPDVFARVQKDDPRQFGNWLSAAQYLDLHSYLPLDILTKVDRMSMAHSLEVRVPLLDHKLVEFAATIPPELNLNGSSGKQLFKKGMRGILPDEVIDRPKRGFAVPLATWFRGELEGFARDLLLSRRCRERNIFNSAYVERLLDLHRGGRPLDLQLWTLMSFEMWCRTFIDKQTQSRLAVAVGASA